MYLDQNLNFKSKIQDIGWALHGIGDSIPQTTENFWSGHYFPFSESWQELQISFSLATFGFYKQAFVSLRSGLELGLLSVYYNINDEGHKVVKEWLNSLDTKNADTPRNDKIWKILLSNPTINLFNNKFQIKHQYENLNYLHNYVHSKGYDFSNSFGDKILSTLPQYCEDVFKMWVETYNSVAQIIITLHILKYPLSIVRFDFSKKYGIDVPMFGNMNESYINAVERVLPEDYFAFLTQLALENPVVTDFMLNIASMPDITDEQVIEQITEMDKREIKRSGLKHWEKNKLTEIEFASTISKDDAISMLNYLNVVKKWAVENGYENS